MGPWLTLGINAASGAAQGFFKDYVQNKANKEQAKGLREQAGIYESMGAAQSRAARMYAGQAKSAAQMGRFNAKNLRLAAAHLDQFEQFALHEATQEARQRVGAGRAAFAANGVLVDSGSAAIWEQDEAADAALERLDIMQQFEDQSWQYRTQANRALAEGYAAAAQHAGAAMGAAGDAYASSLQQAAALSQARRAGKKHWYNTIGGAIGGLFGGGSSMLAGVFG